MHIHFLVITLNMSLPVFDILATSEISMHIKIGVHFHDILWFNVSMTYSLAVHVDYAKHDIPQHWVKLFKG